jgi:hypothetical protein
MTKAKPGETKTFILELKSGNVRRITIPATWKMTFGQLVPHTLRETHGATSQVALRLYEGTKDNLRAVMTDVVAIRDASMVISERRTTIQRKAAQKHTAHGNKDVVVEARITEWVNPDADEEATEPNEFLKLTNEASDL